MAVFVLLCLFLGGAASEEIIVNTPAGGNVTLPCEAPEENIRAVEWNKDGLSEYVLFYRDGRQDTDGQHSSFQGRVQLVHDRTNQKNVSLVLLNVRNSDTGTYECRVASGASRRKRAAGEGDLIKTISLQVKDSGSRPPHLHLGLVALVLVCSAAGAFVLIRRRELHQDQGSGPPAEPLV